MDIATGSFDNTVKIWDPNTGSYSEILELSWNIEPNRTESNRKEIMNS